MAIDLVKFHAWLTRGPVPVSASPLQLWKKFLTMK